MSKTVRLNNDGVYDEVKGILAEARKSAYRAVNFAMVTAYWHIGRVIVHREQGGKVKALYGEALIRELSQKLTKDFGKGFSVANVKNFRQFYLAFPPDEKGHAVRSLSDTAKQDKKSYALRSQSPIPNALRSELSWTHYRLLMRVENKTARAYYLQEAITQNWSTRALERQINSLYYERIVSSKKKKVVTDEAGEKTKALAASPEDFIKDPYVLEFLSLSSETGFLEKDLENAIIEKLQHFLLELGKGFSFVAQQKRISAGEEDFYIDLVFYNYILKCFVLIDLKLGKLTHQDIGQMDLYVRWYEDNIKTSTDNPTIGIILCSEKNETVVKYSILKGSKQLFASKYKLYLPTEEELVKEVEQELFQHRLNR